MTLEGPTWPVAEYRVTTIDKPVRPADLARLATAPRIPARAGVLIITSSASESTVLQAARLGISVLVAPADEHRPTTGLLVHPETHLILLVGAEEHPPQQRSPGRVGWATFAVTISLLDTPASSQRELAQRCGITQGRVSKILRSLEPYWARGQDGLVVTDPVGLTDWLADEYPRRHLAETAWLTLEPLVPLARRLAAQLDESSVRYAVSGDVAADHIAPWANPVLLHLSVDALTDLTDLGLTPAPRGAANVVVSVSADPHLLGSRQHTDGMWLVSPWRVWLDLLAEGHLDAADALRSHLITGGGA